MQGKTLAERSNALIDTCLSALERCSQQADEMNVPPQDLPVWERMFGAKESVISVLNKLVSLQKAVFDLQQRENEYPQSDDEAACAMSEQDWELLALCVERWRERQRQIALLNEA